MPDGHKRKRRNGSKGEQRRRWYAAYRQARFTAHMGFPLPFTPVQEAEMTSRLRTS